MAHLLDNPIYHALNSAHNIFAKGSDDVKYYTEDVSPFAGFESYTTTAFAQLDKLSDPQNTFVIFSPKAIPIPAPWKVLNHIEMFQMVCNDRPLDVVMENRVDIIDLTNAHVPEMKALVELTKPGPFRSKTIELGNYTGLFKNGKLVAMAGHRFHPTPYTEISAVCTHPAYLGKGYAFQLLQEQISRIVNRSEIPFLHVRNDNEGAIKLYQKLGFAIRTGMMAYFIGR
jgi:ribosomal protein S18 acetylase RimI-like enzyme